MIKDLVYICCEKNKEKMLQFTFLVNETAIKRRKKLFASGYFLWIRWIQKRIKLFFYVSWDFHFIFIVDCNFLVDRVGNANNIYGFFLVSAFSPPPLVSDITLCTLNNHIIHNTHTHTHLIHYIDGSFRKVFREICRFLLLQNK